MQFRFPLLFLVQLAFADTVLAEAMPDLVRYWESQAFRCSKDVAVPFPSKSRNDPSNPCDDGDMTLFNGLLCYAGVAEGCVAVRDAQDPASGEWHRSPRIRKLGKNDQGDANSSPDMALGIQLYLLVAKDRERAEKWLGWIDGHVPCTIPLGDRCLVRGLPRFCTEQAGCTIRHGDAAVLAASVDYLHRSAGLPALPNGPLRGHLGTFSGYGPGITQIDAWLNEAGFPQHLVAVSILVLRAAGAQDARLTSAAARLATAQPENAFFEFVANGKTTRAKELTLKLCPRPSQPAREPLNQWQWERESIDKPWMHSMYWDCIFMASLLQ